jgi:hypothetical protein
MRRQRARRPRTARLEAEAARLEAERERTARLAAEARVAELEARLREDAP